METLVSLLLTAFAVVSLHGTSKAASFGARRLTKRSTSAVSPVSTRSEYTFQHTRTHRRTFKSKKCVQIQSAFVFLAGKYWFEILPARNISSFIP